MTAQTPPRSQEFDLASVLFLLVSILIGAMAGFAVASSDEPIKIFIMFIGGLVGAGMALGTLFRPEIGLLALTFMIYTNLSDVAKESYGVPSVLQPFIGLLLLAIVVRWIFSRTRPTGWERPLLAITVYGLLGFFALFYALSYNRAYDAVMEYVKNTIIAIIVAILLQRAAQLRHVVWTLLAAGMLLGTISVFQVMTNTYDNDYGGFARAPNLSFDEAGDMSVRIAGPIGDPNFYAQVIMVLVPLALDRFWSERSLVLRLVAGYALGVVVLTVLFTYSRGAFIAMALTLAIMFVKKPPKPPALIASVIAVLLILPFMPASYTERISGMLKYIPGLGGEDIRNEDSFNGRTSEALAAIMMFTDNPILGVGIGNYNAHYQFYSRQLGMDPRRAERSAHSLYLEIGAEKGIAGLVVFGWLMVLNFRGMARARKLLDSIGLHDSSGIVFAFNAAMLGYLLTSIFLHDAFPRYFWLIYGVMMATPHIAENEIAAFEAQHSKQASPPSVEEASLPVGTVVSNSAT